MCCQSSADFEDFEADRTQAEQRAKTRGTRFERAVFAGSSGGWRVCTQMSGRCKFSREYCHRERNCARLGKEISPWRRERGQSYGTTRKMEKEPGKKLAKTRLGGRKKKKIEKRTTAARE